MAPMRVRDMSQVIQHKRQLLKTIMLLFLPFLFDSTDIEFLKKEAMFLLST
jgi:hypothetical protein